MKHARGSSDDDALIEGEPNVVRERHTGLWLDDGNIIISAKSAETGKTILFRVHKSVLSRQSEAFAGLFSLPDTSANYEEMDGGEKVPLVSLPDDAEGITDLLNLLYNPLRCKYIMAKRNPDFPLMAMRIFKFADKYQMEEVKNELVARFSADWPKDLDEWDQLEFLRNPCIADDRSVRRSSWPEHLLPEPVSAAIFTMEAQVSNVLTAIFYEMYRAERYTDWDNDDTCLVLEKGARWDMATVDQLRKLLHMQDIVQGVLSSKLPRIFLDSYRGFGPDEVDCLTVQHCERILLNKRKTITSNFLESRDPLSVLRLFREWTEESDLCGERKGMARFESEDARRKIWLRITTCVYS